MPPEGHASSARTVESCRYRSDVAADGSSAGCGLLRELTGVDSPRCRVPREACEACCRSFAPTLEALNPVTASLLYAAASELDDAARQSALKARALGAMSWASPRALGDGPIGGSTPAPHNGAAGAPLTPLRDRLPPPHRSGLARVATWAVGVTTAPRREPTLDRCLASLAHAGWTRPHVFIDAPVELSPRAAALPQTYRDIRIGAWPSYALALHELLLREPRADAFLLVQDDSLFYGDEPLRPYLESEVLWPDRGDDRGPGIVSLYCSAAYTKPRPGWHAIRELWGWGALAFIFPNHLAREFLLDRSVFDHRWTGRSHGLAHIDVVIGRWALRRGITIWYPSPSLVQHIGETSALWSLSRAVGERRASWFAGDPERAG
jgi:hypothetical protein